ncbi:MAG: YraN family protein [Oscillospiraceae bacterium]|nr:YraN family protein [Oscillospiraceae bacterium]
MRLYGLGVQGEEKAIEYLKENGYEILQRNFISRFGEIDIIAKNESYLCFVEVKTRKSSFKTEPEFSVDFSKQNKLIKTADYFLSGNESLGYLQPRFDCIFVFYDERNDTFRINLCENAFSVE